jgi:hypothetical protein
MTSEINIPVVPDEIVMSKIYLIRGYKVMLDSDLAELYEVETRVLNQAVNRNQDRFPSDFMFQLEEREWENLMSQIVTSSWGGRRKLPYVFTEHGILMLSSVLNSRKAVQVNILIMRVFTRIRALFLENTELRLAIEKLERKTGNHTQSLELVFKYLDELMNKNAEPIPRRQIGF